MLPVERRARRSFGRIRRRESGRYAAAYVGPDGQLHRRGTTFETHDDAIAWLAAERGLVDLDARGLATWTSPADREAKRRNPQGVTFATYSQTWLANRRTKRGPLKPRTRADYQRLLDRHLLPTFGSRPLRTIGRDDVTDWHDTMNPNAPTERAHAYQLLRAIMATAAETKRIRENPCQLDGAGRVERAHKVETATLEELAAIVHSITPDRLKLAVLLAAWCALRYGEIAELRRKDIRLRSGVVVVARGVTWPDGVATVTTPKTRAGTREVAIPPHLLDPIKRHLNDHVEPGPDSLLFPAVSGGHMHPRTFGKRFAKAREAAGRPDLRFHDLRHTGAVLAAQAGATISELMGRLGHSTPAAAMVYQSQARGRDREIANRLTAMATEAQS